MANERAAIKASLTGSATWTALVSGSNTKWDDEYGATGLEMKTAPATNGVLTICAALTDSTRSPVNLANYGERAFFRLWVYHPSDKAAIQAALYAAKGILNNTYITVDNKGAPLIRWVDDIQTFPADELGGAWGGGSRYQLVHGWF
jgi:hypothetical protein